LIVQLKNGSASQLGCTNCEKGGGGHTTRTKVETRNHQERREGSWGGVKEEGGLDHGRLTQKSLSIAKRRKKRDEEGFVSSHRRSEKGIVTKKIKGKREPKELDRMAQVSRKWTTKRKGSFGCQTGCRQREKKRGGGERRWATRSRVGNKLKRKLRTETKVNGGK